MFQINAKAQLKKLRNSRPLTTCTCANRDPSPFSSLPRGGEVMIKPKPNLGEKGSQIAGVHHRKVHALQWL